VVHHFPCFRDFGEEILRCAAQDGANQSLSVRSNITCAGKACNFRVRTHREKASERVEVTIINLNHTACIGMLANKREAKSHHAFLLDVIPKGMAVHKTTTRMPRKKV